LRAVVGENALAELCSYTFLRAIKDRSASFN